MDLVKEQGIGIEICPFSNQVQYLILFINSISF